MTDSLPAKVPAWFWVLAIILVIWNGMGVMAYIGQVSASSDQLAEIYTAEELSILDRTPAWAIGAFAIGVFAGLLGALALLLRRSWARILFVISLLGVVVQHVWTFFLSGYLDIVPATAAIMPIVVVLVCIFEIWFAGRSINRGWLR